MSDRSDTDSSPDTSPRPETAETQIDRDHLAALQGIAERPLDEHADLYTQVHAGLQSALTDLDDAAR